MEGGEIDFYTVPLTSLKHEAKMLLYCLLDTTKVLLSEGPDKLPRDWRGLARLINISSEIANSYTSDKTAKVINFWIQKRDGTATVGKLLEYVQKIDRYDIFDDFMEYSDKGILIINQQRRPPPARPCNALATLGNNQLMPYVEDEEENIITFEDKIHGAPQFYHAYVMYAYQDKEFVDMLLLKMRERGFKMCTEEDVLPDHATTFAPVSRLISSDRCYRIILVYSPDFLTSPANTFYMDYAQAVGIEMKKPKIIPCMYRDCKLPPSMTFYHKLYYNTPGSKASYDFWDRLSISLSVYDNPSPPRMLNGLTSGSYSTLNITEYNTNSNLIQNGIMSNGLLALPSPPTKSASINGLDACNTELSINSTTSINSIKKPKKRNIFTKVFNLNSKKWPSEKKKKEIKLEA